MESCILFVRDEKTGKGQAAIKVYISASVDNGVNIYK